MDDLAAQFPILKHVGVGRDDGKREGEHMGIFTEIKIRENYRWHVLVSEHTTKPGLGGTQFVTAVTG